MLEGLQCVFGADTLINPLYPLSNSFVAKYDPLGNELWSRAAGGYNNIPVSISSDGDGNVYMVSLRNK